METAAATKDAGANGSAETFIGLTGEAKAVETVAEAVAEEESEKKGKKGKKGKKEKEPPPPSVPFLKLFSFSDPLDWLLMLIGSFGAIIHGAALPVFFLFFGKLINSLGTGDLSAVPGYCLYFVYLGLVVWLGGWLGEFRSMPRCLKRLGCCRDVMGPCTRLGNPLCPHIAVVCSAFLFQWPS